MKKKCVFFQINMNINDNLILDLISVTDIDSFPIDESVMNEENDIINLLSPLTTIQRNDIPDIDSVESRYNIRNSFSCVNDNIRRLIYINVLYLDNIFSIFDPDRKILTILKYGRIDLISTIFIDKNYFYYACRFNNPNMIQWFMNNYHDLDLNVAFQISCTYGSLDITKLLIEKNIKISSFNNIGIILATLNNNINTVKLLIENGAYISEYCFLIACHNGNVDLIQYFTQENCNTSSIEYNYDTGFQYACTKGHFNAIKLLLEYGADINSGFNYACNKCNKQTVDIIKYLIDEGADTSKSLEYACKNNNIHAIKNLLKVGLKFDFTRKDYFDQICKKEIAQYMIEIGLDSNPGTIYNHFWRGNTEIAMLLLQNYRGKETFDIAIKNCISFRCFYIPAIILKHFKLDKDEKYLNDLRNYFKYGKNDMLNFHSDKNKLFDDFMQELNGENKIYTNELSKSNKNVIILRNY